MKQTVDVLVLPGAHHPVRRIDGPQRHLTAGAAGDGRGCSDIFPANGRTTFLSLELRSTSQALSMESWLFGRRLGRGGGKAGSVAGGGRHQIDRLGVGLAGSLQLGERHPGCYRYARCADRDRECPIGRSGILPFDDRPGKPFRAFELDDSGANLFVARAGGKLLDEIAQRVDVIGRLDERPSQLFGLDVVASAPAPSSGLK